MDILVPKLQELPEGRIPPPETLKRKVERNQKLKQMAAEAQAEKTKEIKRIRKETRERLRKYEEEYTTREQELVRQRRAARLQGGFYREDEAKVMFIIRIKGINKLAPKPKKVLQLFRLRQLHNGVFLRVNRATTQMLKYVEPFVTYGYLSRLTITKLLYKRGYGRIGLPGHRQRRRLQNMEIISEHLGQYGVHCIEDIVHELFTCGPNFKQVSNFLWPFKLNCPKKGFVAKRHGFNEPRGGDWGNREHLLNDLVERML